MKKQGHASSSLSRSRIVLEHISETRKCIAALTKKDQTTKIKLLDQLVHLLKDKERDEDEDWAAVVKEFAEKYVRLAVDSAKSVRERVAGVWIAIFDVSECRKAVSRDAGLLGKFIPRWFLSMSDPSNSVATRAVQVFNLVFPEKSRNKVLELCADSIVKECVLNLGHSIESFSDPRVFSAEEAEDRYDRIMQATFNSLPRLFAVLVDSGKQELISQVFEFLKDEANWKAVCKNKREVVRKCAYEFVLFLLEKKLDLELVDDLLNCAAIRNSILVGTLLPDHDKKKKKSAKNEADKKGPMVLETEGNVKSQWLMVAKYVNAFPNVWISEMDEVKSETDTRDRILSHLTLAIGSDFEYDLPKLSSILKFMLAILSSVPFELLSSQKSLKPLLESILNTAFKLQQIDDYLDCVCYILTKSLNLRSGIQVFDFALEYYFSPLKRYMIDSFTSHDVKFLNRSFFSAWGNRSALVEKACGENPNYANDLCSELYLLAVEEHISNLLSKDFGFENLQFAFPSFKLVKEKFLEIFGKLKGTEVSRETLLFANFIIDAFKRGVQETDYIISDSEFFSIVLKFIEKVEHQMLNTKTSKNNFFIFIRSLNDLSTDNRGIEILLKIFEVLCEYRTHCQISKILDTYWLVISNWLSECFFKWKFSDISAVKDSVKYILLAINEQLLSDIRACRVSFGSFSKYGDIPADVYQYCEKAGFHDISEMYHNDIISNLKISGNAVLSTAEIDFAELLLLSSLKSIEALMSVSPQYTLKLTEKFEDVGPILVLSGFLDQLHLDLHLLPEITVSSSNTLKILEDSLKLSKSALIYDLAKDVSLFLQKRFEDDFEIDDWNTVELYKASHLWFVDRFNRKSDVLSLFPSYDNMFLPAYLTSDNFQRHALCYKVSDMISSVISLTGSVFNDEISKSEFEDSAIGFIFAAMICDYEHKFGSKSFPVSFDTLFTSTSLNFDSLCIQKLQNISSRTEFKHSSAFVHILRHLASKSFAGGLAVLQSAMFGSLDFNFDTIIFSDLPVENEVQLEEIKFAAGKRYLIVFSQMLRNRNLSTALKEKLIQDLHKELVCKSSLSDLRAIANFYPLFGVIVIHCYLKLGLKLSQLFEWCTQSIEFALHDGSTTDSSKLLYLESAISLAELLMNESLSSHDASFSDESKNNLLKALYSLYCSELMLNQLTCVYFENCSVSISKLCERISKHDLIKGFESHYHTNLNQLLKSHLAEIAIASYNMILLSLSKRCDAYELDEKNEVFNESRDIISGMLPKDVIKFITKAEINPIADGHEIRSHFLRWFAILELLEHLDVEKKQYLIDFIRLKSNCLGQTLSDCIDQLLIFNELEWKQDLKNACLFENAKLVSEDMIPYFPNVDENRANSKKFKLYVSYFEEHDIQLNMFYPKLAVKFYLKCLQLLPSLSRNWFNELDRSFSANVSTLTSSYFSPCLTEKEFELAMNCPQNSDLFRIRTNNVLRAISAETLENPELSMKLVVKLASNHPLTVPQVDIESSVVAEAMSRKWRINVSSILNSRNGVISEAITTWKANVEKYFEGVEDCPICYSVVHASTNALPKMICRTCKNKFHSACLYRWFSTSMANSCPLCRSVF